MLRSMGVFGRTGRCVASSFLAVAVLAGIASDAEARRRHRAQPYSPPYASIVVDVKTGKVLQAVHPDAKRHPASITKVMTLYMLFEQLERGRFTLDSELKVSARAARMAPSKIGFQPGETIRVEDAIRALVTKSANDVAAAVAENIAGSEDHFAELMTQKAHAIGMRSSNFANASGLPNPEQVTTARDLALLGRAIQDRFPKYYGYFSTRVFNYDGAAYRNHNKLLGRVEGVDGIKTGYTRASGFNLLTSAKSDGRHVIAVVLGGRSGRARDAQVAALVDEHLPRAWAGARQTARVVEVAQADDEDEKPAARLAQAAPAPAPAPAAAPQAIERPRAIIAAAQPVAAAAIHAPVAAPAVVEARPRLVASVGAPVPRPAAPVLENMPRPAAPPLALTATGTGVTPRVIPAPVALAAVTPSNSPALRWNVGPQPVAKPQSQARLVPPGTVRFTNSADTVEEADLEQPLPPAAKTQPVVETEKSQAKVAQPAPQPQRAVQVVEASKSRSGWVIQLGATDDEGKARGLLDKAKTSAPKVLADADAFTEKVQKGDATLFRARFGGFESNEAEAACRTLKRSGFACFAQRI